MNTTANDNRRARSQAIANASRDAYSANRYANWHEVARVLLTMGFTDAEAETVMRSKITRWAADNSNRPYGKVPAVAVRHYITNDEARRGFRVREEIRQWTRESAQ